MITAAATGDSATDAQGQCYGDKFISMFITMLEGL